MHHLKTTYQHIANILSFTTSSETLEKTLSNPSFNWDNIVIEGSKHLVLPAIYCRLKAKKLCHLLPPELNTYLEELTTLNANRNCAIIKQINTLSSLLKQHNIDHVFLKGAALLIGDFYDNIAERMVGDIDILVADNQLDDAFNLLKENNYKPLAETLGSTFFEHKHLPRLITENNICAVELHRKLFMSYQDNDLKNTSVLAHKQTYKNNTIALPALKHLLKHNVLNFQVNDKGQLYNSISFRPAYDSIILLNRLNFNIPEYNGKIFKNYFNIAGLFFQDLKPLGIENNSVTRFYLFKLKHVNFYKSWNKLLTVIYNLPIFMNRAYLLVFNRLYRQAVIKDRARILKHFKDNYM